MYPIETQIMLEQGRLHDWRALARFHYRSGRLGPYKSIWRLIYEPKNASSPLNRRMLVGVIVYSMPVPQIAIRNRIFGDRFAKGPIGNRLQRLSREMRTISRVVIHPIFRGLSLAGRIVRETLPLAGTPYVEALAAMGRVHPFFERAGMTPWQPLPDLRRERFIAALDLLGLSPDDLLDHQILQPRIKSLSRRLRNWFDRELDRFCRTRPFQ